MKPIALGIRNVAGNDCANVRVPRKLDDPQRLVLVRAEIARAVIQRLLHALHHLGQVVLVAAVIVNAEVHVVPAIPSYLVPRLKGTL